MASASPSRSARSAADPQGRPAWRCSSSTDPLPSPSSRRPSLKHVEGGRHLGQQGRVAEGVAQHQVAHPESAGSGPARRRPASTPRARGARVGPGCRGGRRTTPSGTRPPRRPGRGRGSPGSSGRPGAGRGRTRPGATAVGVNAGPGPGSRAGRVIGHLGQHLVGEAVEALDGVLGAPPGLHQGPADAGVGVAPQGVGVGVPDAEGDLDGARPPGLGSELGQAGRLGRYLLAACGSWGSTRPAAAPPGGAPPGRHRRCGSAATGVCTGLGSNITGPKSKNSPWCSTTSSLQSRRQTLQGLVDPPAPGREVETDGLPLRLQPAGTDAELDPAPRHHVEGGDGPGGDERVAEADVVHLGAEVDAARSGRPGIPGR